MARNSSRIIGAELLGVEGGGGGGGVRNVRWGSL